MRLRQHAAKTCTSFPAAGAIPRQAAYSGVWRNGNGLVRFVGLTARYQCQGEERKGEEIEELGIHGF